MTKKEIVLFGYSGHSFVVNDCLNGAFIMGYYDLKEKANNPLQLSYLGEGNSSDFSSLGKDTCVFPSVGDNQLRKKLRTTFIDNSLNETRVIHPNSTVSESSTIGLSTLIGPQAIVNAFAKIGNGVIINSGAIIEHECVVSDFVHIAPGAVLAGCVSVGEGSLIGANTVVKEGISIGVNVIIGAGSVILNDIPDNEMWAGNPDIKKKSL